MDVETKNAIDWSEETPERLLIPHRPELTLADVKELTQRPLANQALTLPMEDLLTGHSLDEQPAESAICCTVDDWTIAATLHQPPVQLVWFDQETGDLALTEMSELPLEAQDQIGRRMEELDTHLGPRLPVNAWWPVKHMSPNTTTVELLAEAVPVRGLPVTLVRIGDALGLVPNAVGLDLVWYLAEAFVRLGVLPPLALADHTRPPSNPSQRVAALALYKHVRSVRRDSQLLQRKLHYGLDITEKELDAL